MGVLRRWASGVIPRSEDITVDGPVFAFALSVSLLSGILFGLFPAWRLSGSRTWRLLLASFRGSDLVAIPAPGRWHRQAAGKARRAASRPSC